jgi:hypothetical protein
MLSRQFQVIEGGSAQKNQGGVPSLEYAEYIGSVEHPGTNYERGEVLPRENRKCCVCCDYSAENKLKEKNRR